MSKVWVISPDSDTRRLIRLNLGKRGLQIREVSSQLGLLPSDEAPELIILDSDVEGQVDWGAARALRLVPGLQDVPIILMVASAPQPGRLATLQPADWVEKPLAMDALLALVWQSLG